MCTLFPSIQTCGSQREARHTPPDLSAVRSTLSVSIPRSLSLSLCCSHTLYLVYSMSSGIPSIILVVSCRAPDSSSTAWRMFKGLFVPLRAAATQVSPSDAIIWWWLRYFQGRRSLFFVSLNTHNKQRVPNAATVIPFTLPSLSLRIAWLHADRWFEFEPCRHALISDMLWIYLTS